MKPKVVLWRLWEAYKAVSSGRDIVCLWIVLGSGFATWQ